jgi:antitoxin component YwqK of YwqJK toxin-antitoxin module
MFFISLIFNVKILVSVIVDGKPMMNFIKETHWSGQCTFFIRRLIAKIPQGVFRNWFKNGAYIEERFANGQRKVISHYRYGKRYGLTVLWYENGQRFAQGCYQNDREEGLWEEWSQNGLKRKEGHYRAGQLDGLWTEWWEASEQLEKQGDYKNGEKMGRWTCWYENGKKKSEGYFKAGKQEALWSYWYESGDILREQQMRAGKLHGSYTVWNTQGLMYKKELYSDGVLQRAMS